MELQNIYNLINKKKFEEAKTKLIELVKKQTVSDNNLFYRGGIYKNIYFTLSQVCNQLNELEKSIKYLKNHLNINKQDSEALLNLANLYLRTRKIKKAEIIYKRIIKIENNNIGALINLAFLYEGMGKINNAIKYYQIAKNLYPNNLNFYYNLIRLNNKYLSDNQISFIEKLNKENRVPDKDKYLSDLILSKNYEKKKDYLNEIKFIEKSHEKFLKFNVNKKSYKYWRDIIPYCYNKFKYKNDTSKKLKNMNPVFIIGLPRSGSTITELILSTSKTPKHSLGETSMINSIIINQYGEKLFDNSKKDEIEIDLNLVEEKIISNLRNFDITISDQTILIDKSLENFYYLDLLIKIFPKAKFVITERNINDNVIGIFKKVLIDIPWAHSILNIIQYINIYKKIINDYKKRYKEKLHFIKLDDLQNFNDEKVDALFNFCGLDYNSNYFKFQKQNQFISNASNLQIRSSLKKYDKRKYEKYYDLLNQYNN